MALPYSRFLIGSLPWYSVLVVTGIALAILLACSEEKRLSLPKDTFVDLALIAVPFGIIGARAYYVLMRWEIFSAQPVKTLYIWEGGLAIYGAVIGGAVGVWLYAHKKKISFYVLADAIAPGLMLAQAVGRWGNYFNMEAYGPAITEAALQFFPIAVLIPEGGGYTWHAATFFYESMWNLCGFAALWRMRRHQQEKGNVFAWYLLIYGAGRFVIEQLRQDSLYIGSLRASQYLSLILCAVSSVLLIWRACKRNRKVFVVSVLICAAWIARWMALDHSWIYGGLMLIAGVSAVWLKRDCPKAIAWLAAAFVLDGSGLLAHLLQVPVCAEAGQFVHALICSITLPVGVYALCKTNHEGYEGRG